MSFITPLTALLAAAVAIPALVLLYFLKLRRRPAMVASTLLWKRAVQDMQVNAPFQRIRRNLLLLLQLILLLLLLFALARPAIWGAAETGRQVVILIDHSASMNATDGRGGGTRLEEARRVALDLLDQLGADPAAEGSGVMVLSFAERPQVWQTFTRDRTRLRAAVQGIEATDQRSMIAPALAMIEPFALQAAAASGQATGMSVYVISDGAVHAAEGVPPALPGAEMKFVQVGGHAPSGVDNVGFVSFSARRDFERPQEVHVYARLANFGSQEVRSNVSLRLIDESGSRVLRVDPVTLPPATTRAQGDGAAGVTAGPGSQALQFSFILAGSARVEVTHDHRDQLAADDTVRMILAPARRLRVLLVTEGNGFLEQVLRAGRARELVLMTPKRYEDQDPGRLRRGGWDIAGTGGSGEGFDLVVFDRYAPQAIPPLSGLYLGAVPPIAGLQWHPAREGDAESVMILDWNRTHPLLRYVHLDDVILSRPGRLALPETAIPLAVGPQGPVLAEVLAGRAEGQAEGTRHVVTSFDLLASNWPLYVSFPVFVSNVMEELGLGGLGERAGISYRPGEVAVIPDVAGREGQRVDYRGPVTLEAPLERGRAVLPALRRVGLYTAADPMPAPYHELTVNLLDETESDLRLVERLEVGAVSAEARGSRATIQIEIGWWFALAALGMLLIEWLIYTRRMHL